MTIADVHRSRLRFRAVSEKSNEGRTMVYAYHLIWTAYGWWLPNDPRGSMSHTIRNDCIADLGELHYGRKRVQPGSRDIRAFYEQARSRLQHELLTFTDSDIGMIA